MIFSYSLEHKSSISSTFLPQNDCHSPAFSSLGMASYFKPLIPTDVMDITSVTAASELQNLESTESPFTDGHFTASKCIGPPTQ